MLRISIKLFSFLIFSVQLNAQQKGSYVTLDQLKQINLLDTNRIVIIETSLKNNFETIIITGIYKRKFKRLIVQPISISIDAKSASEQNQDQIVYKLKSVTGQKFMIKQLDLDEDYQSYYLQNSLHFGIE